MIELKKANKKAIDYACKYYHYSKTVPAAPFGYSVFTEDEVWCGVIIFGYGANNNLAKSFNLGQGEVIELTRVALNSKQGFTSEVVGKALKQLKKDAPLVKIVVSYADEKQGHKGVIYQATNWYFVGDSFAESAIDPADGKLKHTRILHQKYGTIKGFKRVKDKAKHKYLYPFDKKLRKICEAIKLPYPK